MESLGCRRANDLLLLAARHQHELGKREPRRETMAG